MVDGALDRPPAARDAYLEAACRADPGLHADAARLVEACERAEREGGVLAAPAVALATPLLADLAADAAARAEAQRAALADAAAAALAGRYAVERELGRGGMATVYLARDPKHDRPVAVKVLAAELTALMGAERFAQEVRVTARLQHPHILALLDSGVFGPEAGALAGRPYYVMPYVEGPSLRTRLEREGALPVADAVRIAQEVASALDYAHRHGVVHRDVKPENVLLHEGSALVADFGIALAVAQAGGARLTQTGLSLGTPAYMAPEQAMGERQITARTDVYALGAVTYEMLAGEPPFPGPTAQAVVARVMTESPRSLTAQRPSVPPAVDAAVRTALEKLPADRFASASAFAAALTAPVPSARDLGRALTAPTRSRHLAPRVAALATAVLAVGAAFAWGAQRGTARALAGRTPTPEHEAVRFSIQIDSGSLDFGSGPVISPDGRTVVYAARGPEGPRLYARPLDQLVAQPIPGTEDGILPFFSPDGGWVAFFSHGALRKIRLDGGTSLVVTAAPSMSTATPSRWDCGWGTDDVILCSVASAASTMATTLIRVSAGGGTPSAVRLADTTAFLLTPHPLPRRNAVLVTVVGARMDDGRVGVLDLATGRVRRFGPGQGPRYVAGAVVYASANGALLRQPFDLDRLEPTGPPEPVTNDLDVFDLALTGFDVSETGTLVYRPAGSGLESLKLILTDRAGHPQRVIPSRAPWAPRFSPDGRRVAYGAVAPGERESDLWVTELAVGTTQRLTADHRDANDPQWSPDGRAIAYSVNSSVNDGTGKHLAVQTLDGGAERPLTRRPGTQWPSDWAPDGSGVVFTDNRDARGAAGEPVSLQEIWVQPPDGSPPHPYLATAAHERAARVSADGHWAAYVSDETGRDEVYVQSYPTPGHKVLVSDAGGDNPVWRRDGRELYYWQGDQLIAAELGAGDPRTVRGRTPVFRAPYSVDNYDVAADGTRFVLVTGNTRANRLVVALNALGGRLPARR